MILLMELVVGISALIAGFGYKHTYIVRICLYITLIYIFYMYTYAEVFMYACILCLQMEKLVACILPNLHYFC